MATSVDQVERLKELQSLVLDVHSNLYRMRTIGKHRGLVYEYQHGDDGRMVKVYHDGRIEDGGEEPWQATSIAVSRLGGFPVSSITEAIRPACAPVEPIAWVRDLVDRSQMLMHGYSVDGPDWEPRAATIWHAGAVSLNFAIAQAVAVATVSGDAPEPVADDLCAPVSAGPQQAQAPTTIPAEGVEVIETTGPAPIEDWRTVNSIRSDTAWATKAKAWGVVRITKSRSVMFPWESVRKHGIQVPLAADNRPKTDRK